MAGRGGAWRGRHMFEVEQMDYEKERIDWSYIAFKDNKVHFYEYEVHSFGCHDRVHFKRREKVH